MAELRNAQRISYKATYNQISPTATVHEPPSSSRRPVPRRAFDKAAFVQSLRIVAEELPVLEEGDLEEREPCRRLCSRRAARQRPHRVRRRSTTPPRSPTSTRAP